MTMTLTQTPKSLSRKMTYGVVFLLLLTTVVVVGVMSLRVQPRVIQVSGELIEQTGTAIVGEMSRQLARTQGVTVSVARLAESLPPDEQVYKTVAPAIIDDQGNTALAGGGIWPEPGRFTQGVERRSFFWARDASSRLVFSDDYNAPSGAGYHGEGWYTGARGKRGNACVWSDAYQDPVSHVAMVTCSVPYQLSGSFAGVATTDMALDGIARFLEQRGSTTGGYAFAVDATGQLLWFPGLASKEMTTLEKLAGAQTWLQPVAARLPSLSDKVTVDLDHDERLGGASKVALFRMPETGWVIGLATPEERYIYLANATMRDILVFLLPLLAAVLAFAWLWGRHVIRRLDATRQALDEICHGDGDLARRLVDPQRDEIAGVALAFNRFVDKLSRVLLSVRGSSDFVAQAVSRLDADNQNLASRTSQQATAMEESAAALEQLMSSVQQNAENIHVADKMVNETVEFVEENGMAMRKVVGVMNEIETSSRKVSEIIGVINSIAFQTNILALNAAVEAARAGEQGRGFAVVATEVRALAQRSAAAAAEIKTLIGESVDSVRTGGQLVRAAEQNMGQLQANVHKTRTAIAEIRLAGDEQKKGLSEVTDAVSQIDGVVQQNAAMVNDAAQTTRELSVEARQLAELVGSFRLEEADGGAPAPEHRARAIQTRLLNEA